MFGITISTGGVAIVIVILVAATYSNYGNPDGSLTAVDNMG
jgi:hypothetical protein